MITEVLDMVRIEELNMVLGPEQRSQLLAALESQALEASALLRRHFEAGDDRAISREAHRLKGAAQLIGADRLIAALSRVEERQPGAVVGELFDAVDTQIAALAIEIKKLKRTA